MYEVSIVGDYYEAICYEDNYEYKGKSIEEVTGKMEAHEQELKELAEKEQKWLLKGDIRNKLIQLSNNIDSLINVAHETYMSTPETDIENRARLDAQIQAYWNVISMVEDILVID